MRITLLSPFFRARVRHLTDAAHRVLRGFALLGRLTAAPSAPSAPSRTQLALLIGCSLAVSVGHAQTWALTDSIAVTATHIKTDPLGQLYIVDDARRLIKYNSQGDSTNIWGDTRYGDIGSIDVSDPMEPMVWYPDVQTIVLLDRTLNRIGEVVLPRLSFGQVLTVCRGYDKTIWLYERGSRRLRQINAQGAVQLQGPIEPFLESDVAQGFSQMIFSDGHILISDGAKGYFSFDIFGKFEKTGVSRGDEISLLDVQRDIVYTAQDGNIIAEAIDSAQPPQSIPLPTNTTVCAFSDERLVTGRGSKVYIWFMNEGEEGDD